MFSEDLDPPALALGITRVHAEQVAGEDRRLVAAGAGTGFPEHVAPVVGSLGSSMRCRRSSSPSRAVLAWATSSSAISRISGRRP